MASTLQHFVQPAQELFGYQKQPYFHTQYEQLDSTQSSPNTTYTSTMYSPAFPPEDKPFEVNRKTMQRYHKLQRITGIVFGVADVCSCLLTFFMEAVMVYVLVKFYQTRNIPSPGRTGPWSKQTKLWPTYMLASAALVTFILAVVGLVLACRKKRKGKGARLTLKVIRVVIHVGCWIAIVAFYRIAKTGKDLWGWSCSDKAAALQQYYNGPLDFERLCTVQTASWFVSIAEVGVKILFAIVGFYLQIEIHGIKRSIIKDSGEIGWDAFQNFS